MFKAIGRVLREERKKRGMTLCDVESLSGYTNGYLSQLENGLVSNPGHGTLIKIIESIGLSYSGFARKVEREQLINK